MKNNSSNRGANNRLSGKMSSSVLKRTCKSGDWRDLHKWRQNRSPAPSTLRVAGRFEWSVGKFAADMDGPKRKGGVYHDGHIARRNVREQFDFHFIEKEKTCFSYASTRRSLPVVT